MDPERHESAVDRLLYGAADLFMFLMLSRPSTGSLRVTRVTTVSMGLSLATAAVLLGAGVVLLASGSGTVRWVIAALLIALGLGSASVGVVALRQRAR